MTEGRTGLRLKVLAMLVVAMFAALSTRLWFLQVLAAEDYRERSANNAVRLVEVPAPRGRILDASGEKLVENRLSLVLTVNRQQVGDREEDVLYRLSQLLDVPATELGARLEDDRYYVFTPVPVAIDIPKRVMFYIKEHTEDFPGVDVVESPVRSYPFGGLAGHLLGYLGQISKEKLASPDFAGYEAGDLVGVAGLESVYEHDVAGRDGIVKYRVNSQGENLGEIGEQPPVRGDDLVLTLDVDIQRLAEESLRLGMRHARGVFDPNTGRNLAANAGAVVVLDPETGGIEAMASVPGFQPTVFTRSMSPEEFESRFGAANGYPLLNRAIAGQYPPGSTYKPWIALSALRREVVSVQRGYPCPPSWTAPFDEDNPSAVRYVFNNWTSANLGFMNLATALSKSCDTVFYPMGYEYWRTFYPPPWADGVEGNEAEPAREPLQRDLRALGFGSLTNVDLPGEEEGRVPDATWKREIHEFDPKKFPDGDWFPGDFVLMTIGQGDTLVTPLQLAAAYAALQNDGKACVPHLLDRVDDPDGRLVRRYKPNCRGRLPFDAAYLTYVREALTGTVRSGTAAGAFAGFPFGTVWIAGKTGTAEVEPKQDYSWFAAMTEAGGEEHVVVVLVEQGGHGSTTAAPIARHIIEGIYGLDFSQFVDVAGTD
ncbi:MAG TPA: penicillin-binding protein 2 [Actinomycetota bacterium]|nr:penicillin-binding protein 2 [Actinomycetota bacterium]